MRGTYAAHRAPGDHRAPEELGVTAIELMPVHHFVNDSTLIDKGLCELLGLQHHRLLRAGPEVLQRGIARRAGAGVQGDGARPARGGHRGHPRRRLQPHRRGQPPRPDAVASAASTTPPTTGWSTTTSSYYMDYTGTGNTLNVRHPHSLQLIMDSLRYWVTEMHVDGFRFDLAATLAREFYDVDRLSTFFELVQQDPIGQPGQAHRRAVGRRPRRLPGRQLPAAVDGVERQVPRHRPRLLARRAGDARRVRVPAHRLGRPLRALRPPAGRVDQLRHRARRLHAARPGLLQREAQRGQRRGQQRRREPQPLVELRRRGADRRRRRSSRCARGSSATSSPRCCCRQGVPMICHGDELGRTQGGNNNGYCQDNEITWIDWAKVDADLLAFTRTGVDAARRAPGLPPAPVLRRPAGAPPRPGRPARHRLVHPGRHRDDRGGLGLGLRRSRSPCSSTARASRPSTRAGSASSTTRSCCASTPTTSRSTSPFRQRNSARRGSRDLHRSRGRATIAGKRCVRRSSPSTPTPRWCCKPDPPTRRANRLAKVVG